MLSFVLVSSLPQAVSEVAKAKASNVFNVVLIFIFRFLQHSLNAFVRSQRVPVDQHRGVTEPFQLNCDKTVAILFRV